MEVYENAKKILKYFKITKIMSIMLKSGILSIYVISAASLKGVKLINAYEYMICNAWRPDMKIYTNAALDDIAHENYNILLGYCRILSDEGYWEKTWKTFERRRY